MKSETRLISTNQSPNGTREAPAEAKQPLLMAIFLAEVKSDQSCIYMSFAY